VELFGGNHRETFTQIKPHLISKDTFSARSRAIAFFMSVLQNVFDKVVVLLHSISLKKPARLIFNLVGLIIDFRKDASSDLQDFQNLPGQK
jgi:hypothetical protein